MRWCEGRVLRGIVALVGVVCGLAIASAAASAKTITVTTTTDTLTGAGCSLRALASARFRVAAGRSEKVKPHLTVAAAGRVKHAGILVSTATAAATDGLKRRVKTSSKICLRPAVAHKRHRSTSVKVRDQTALPTTPQIYWGNVNTIGDANLDGSNVNQSFITGAKGPNGVAVNGRGIYWTNSGNVTIGDANLDGSGVNQSLISPSPELGGMAVDGAHVYWANFDGTAVERANLDGTGVDQSFINAGSPQGVAVGGGHIYWTNQGSGTIGVANLDGSGVNQSLITGASDPIGVAVDAHHVYWTNSTTDTIGEANLDGTDVNQSFISGANGPWGVAVDDQHVYWANRSSGTIGEANLDGTGVNQTFISGASSPQGVAVSVPVAQISPSSPPAFAATMPGAVSAPELLTVTNQGQRSLSITDLTLAGTDPSDFEVTSSGCGSIAPGQTCQLTIRFMPQAVGTRTATLQVVTNDVVDGPLQVQLSGTGTAASQGPLPTPPSPGPTPGPPSPSRPTPTPPGPPSRPGHAPPKAAVHKIEILTCKPKAETVKRHGHKTHVKRLRCTGKMAKGKVQATTRAGGVTVSRGHVRYAIGRGRRLSGGRLKLRLNDLRRLRRGRYTLAEKVRRGGREVTIRMTITIE